MQQWRHYFSRAGVAILAITLEGCSAIKDPNASAIYNSKHPDQTLFNSAATAIERNRFDVARMTLLTLVNTYPDSEYAGKAETALQDPRMNPCAMAWMTPIPDVSVPCTNIDSTFRWQY